MMWKEGIEGLVQWTTPYLPNCHHEDQELMAEWRKVVGDCSGQWSQITGTKSVTTSLEDMKQSDEEEEEPWIMGLEAALEELG